MDSLSACLFKEANFHCFLSYPLQWPSPALWARFMKGFTLVKKIRGRVLYKQSCPCVLAASCKGLPLAVRFQTFAFPEILKQSRRVDSLSACLFKEANFHCFLSYPLQWPSPALWARFMKGFTLVEKIPGRAFYKQSCPCVLAAS